MGGRASRGGWKKHLIGLSKEKEKKKKVGRNRREYQLLQVGCEVDAFQWGKLRQAITTAGPGEARSQGRDAGYGLMEKSLSLCPWLCF